MVGSDSLRRETKDIPNSKNWKERKAMSSRFVLLNLRGHKRVTLIIEQGGQTYVCTGQLRATRHSSSSMTSSPLGSKPFNLTAVRPFDEATEFKLLLPDAPEAEVVFPVPPTVPSQTTVQDSVLQ